MATYDLEEQEQLAEIKAWWKQYGGLITNLLTAAALVILAWQGWNWYQRNQAAQAGVVFNALQQAVQVGDSQRVKAASGELLEKFGGTAYAPLGALSAAKAMVEAGDAKTAKLQLIWVAENGKDELRDLGRLRAASLLSDEKEFEQALKQLEGESTPGFAARFAELRGDILLAQGKKGEAETAYQKAMSALSSASENNGAQKVEQGWQLQSNAVQRELLQQKIDSLGESKQ
ncbi:YfgM family protein [Propionivibrio limicola]|uniref:YfgM family protein n=1 Tax=Propionivibrio limicola TaxID=167645 RepID=UPI001291A09F|nr:tetratricopeptide repeat protein [Propionivibrio limicola]